MNSNICKMVFLSTVSLVQFEMVARNINLAIGQKIRLEYPSNPTTGYRWQITTDLNQNSPVVILKDGYQPSQPRRIGSGGKQFWIIKGQKSGTITLNFEYVRPWEKDREPENTKEITITVK